MFPRQWRDTREGEKIVAFMVASEKLFLLFLLSTTPKSPLVSSTLRYLIQSQGSKCSKVVLRGMRRKRFPSGCSTSVLSLFLEMCPGTRRNDEIICWNRVSQKVSWVIRVRVSEARNVDIRNRAGLSINCKSIWKKNAKRFFQSIRT